MVFSLVALALTASIPDATKASLFDVVQQASKSSVTCDYVAPANAFSLKNVSYELQFTDANNPEMPHEFVLRFQSWLYMFASQSIVVTYTDGFKPELTYDPGDAATGETWHYVFHGLNTDHLRVIRKKDQVDLHFRREANGGAITIDCQPVTLE